MVYRWLVLMKTDEAIDGAIDEAIDGAIDEVMMELFSAPTFQTCCVLQHLEVLKPGSQHVLVGEGMPKASPFSLKTQKKQMRHFTDSLFYI